MLATEECGALLLPRHGQLTIPLIRSIELLTNGTTRANLIATRLVLVAKGRHPDECPTIIGQSRSLVSWRSM